MKVSRARRASVGPQEPRRTPVATPASANGRRPRLEEMREHRRLRDLRAFELRPHAPPVHHGAGGALSFLDRKSTRLNSSHDQISYAVFCLKKKNKRFLCQYST